MHRDCDCVWVSFFLLPIRHIWAFHKFILRYVATKTSKIIPCKIVREQVNRVMRKSIAHSCLCVCVFVSTAYTLTRNTHIHVAQINLHARTLANIHQITHKTRIFLSRTIAQIVIWQNYMEWIGTHVRWTKNCRFSSFSAINFLGCRG